MFVDKLYFNYCYQGDRVGESLQKNSADSPLRQKERLSVEPHFNLSVVKINSSYLEIDGPEFGWRGMRNFAGLLTLGGCLITSWHDFGDFNWFDFIFFGAIFLLALGMILIESFTWTHYPLRFNRKTRQVFVFRPGLPPLEAAWDEIFFAAPKPKPPVSDIPIFGMVLDKQGIVQQSFRLGILSSDIEANLRYWEFIRRYMEDGPETIIDGVDLCLPLNGHREPLLAGMERMFANVASQSPYIFVIIFSPILFAFTVGRWISMYTSRVPVWPKHIEEACTIEPNDPYEKDERINPRWLQPWFGLRHKNKSK